MRFGRLVDSHPRSKAYFYHDRKPGREIYKDTERSELANCLTDLVQAAKRHWVQQNDAAIWHHEN